MDLRDESWESACAGLFDVLWREEEEDAEGNEENATDARFLRGPSSCGSATRSCDGTYPYFSALPFSRMIK